MTTQANAGASAPNSNPAREFTVKNKEQALVKFGINPDDIIQQNGRYWMTAEEIGIALGYNYPRESIIKLYNRHKDELEPYKGEVKLTSVTGLHETSIFNTDGMWLLAIFANTQKAKKFRKFIVNMLKALEREEFIPISRHNNMVKHWKSQIEEWRKELIDLKISVNIYNSKVMTYKKYNKMIRYREMGLTQKETAKLLDISRDTVQQFERIPRRYKLQSPTINQQSSINNHQSSILRPVMPKTLFELRGGAA